MNGRIEMELNDCEKIEKVINLTYNRPAISNVHRRALRHQILAQFTEKRVSDGRALRLFPSWRLASGMLVLICLSLILIRPTTVWAQIVKWLGYSPSAGLISKPDSVMTLVEPIHFAAEQYSLVIPEAVLSSDRTLINYLVFQRINSGNQAGQNCAEPAYITVSGTSEKYFETTRGLFPALPNGTSEVFLNIPCVTNSKGNDTESIVLKFKESPERTIEAETNNAEFSIEEGLSGTVKVAQYFLEQDKIVLVTELNSRKGVNEYFHISGVPVIQDSDGKIIAYESPLGTNVSEGNRNFPINFNFKFSVTGVKFPVTVRFMVKLTEGPASDIYAGKPEDWSAQWAPALTKTVEETSICINEDNITNLKSAPMLSNAEYLAYQSDGVWAIFDGFTRSIVNANDALDVRISPDRKRAAIVYPDRFVIRHLSSGEETSFVGRFAPNIFWNAESKSVALQVEDKIVVYSIDGKKIVSILIPEGSLLAGWISSESLLYGTPERSGNGYLLRYVNMSDQASLDLFYLDHSAGKNINLSVSPDGEWVTYRGEKQATLFIKNLETGEVKQIMDAATTMVNPAAIDSFFWTNDSRSLVIEVLQPTTAEIGTYVLDVESCEVRSIGDDQVKVKQILRDSEQD